MNSNVKKCGNCIYSQYDTEVQDYICTSEESINYGVPISTDEYCNKWEEVNE